MNIEIINTWNVTMFDCYKKMKCYKIKGREKWFKFTLQKNVFFLLPSEIFMFNATIQ